MLLVSIFISGPPFVILIWAICMYVLFFFFLLFFSSMSKIICSPCNCHTCLFILSQKTITGKLTCCMLQEVNNRLVSLFGDVFVKMDRPFCDTDTS